jgi:RNA polymerase sigma-70 factor (sigma-E family)
MTMQRFPALPRQPSMGSNTVDEFVQEHARQLVRTAYLLTGNMADAEDLSQEVLVKVTRQWRRVRRADAQAAYLNRMLVNEFLSQKRRRQPIVSHLSDLDDPPAPADIATQAVERDALMRALATVAPRERAIVVLRFFGQLEHAEIAAIMGIGESTSRASASRGVKALRTYFNRLRVEESEEFQK